jgi:RNA polymerase sigma-70 factor (ECF subfamily)
MANTAPNEEELLKRCIAGDKETWNIFVQKYSKLVLHSIYKTFRAYDQPTDPDDVDDLFQEAFTLFYSDDFKRLRIFDPTKGRTLASWLRLLTVRMTINYIKKQRPTTSLDDLPLEPSQASNEGTIIDEESQKNLVDVLEELPLDDKLLIELSYIKELPPEIVAQMLHIAVGTFYTRKNRIINKIRKIASDRKIL